MTVQTFQGFLLTRNWRDTPGGIELEYWFATDSGPLCAIIRGEQSVFFLEKTQLEQAHSAFDTAVVVEIKPVKLRSFGLAPVVGIYCNAYRQARRLADTLRDLGLDPLEADINPADRFLMERFVMGSAIVQGEPRQLGLHLLLDNPAVKASDYRPALKVVSYDIETAMEGVQLYSIGVHGVEAGQHTRRVFMVGEGAQQDFVQACASQE